MSSTMSHGNTIAATGASLSSPVYQAYQILRVGFTVAPILAGLDKFFHLLTNWDQYLAPVVNRALDGHGHQFMLAVGIIEIVAGIGVFFMPRVFSYVCAVIAFFTRAAKAPQATISR